MPHSVDTVVFDIGNVLIHWDPRLLYRDIFGNDEEADRFLAEVCTHDWNLQQDLGRTFKDAIAERLALFPDHAEPIRAWDSRWHDMVPSAIDGTVTLLEELKSAGVPLYAITNFSGEKFAECQERFPFLANSFRDIVVSAHERCVKPDRRIYDILFERNPLDPAQTIFIDDSLPNVEGARAAGMEAVHFTGPEALRQHLQGLGFPV
ncbi:HAD family hydrolase [Stappia indica]|uniref:HAD family hydrolase n=1 Tax=Stappia indica TaxID=538381 RepID=UPI001CD5507C|nr:HAD family phosphatase [Stappia indica]MCA1300804.1 HAD family phosphatase [Stappia indica]